MLCQVDFEFPEAFFFSELNTCCARAWASPELSLGASSSEGWIIAWDKSPLWTVLPQLPGELSVCCAVQNRHPGASGNRLCSPLCPACGHSMHCAQESEREGRSFSVSSVPTPPHFESKSGRWLKPTLLLTIHGEQKPIPGRGDLKCPGAGVASNPFISNIQRIHSKCSHLTTLQSDGSVTNELLSFGSLCWTKWENLFEASSWLILIAAVSSCCVGL